MEEAINKPEKLRPDENPVSQEGQVEANESSSQSAEIHQKFKVIFEGEVAKKLRDLTEELKQRGVDAKRLTTLLGEDILEKSSAFWEKWLEEVTPGQFYLRSIQQNPKLEAKLAKVLKQMYLGRSRVTEPKRKSKTEQAEQGGTEVTPS